MPEDAFFYAVLKDALNTKVRGFFSKRGYSLAGQASLGRTVPNKIHI